MIPESLREKLADKIARAEDAREQAVDVMFEIQNHYGYMTDEAMREASALLGMTTLELEELATFYDHIYRSPVGRYVIRVCDSTICWMEGHERVVDYISSRLGIRMGGTTADGLFTLLPVVCIGYCDRSPAMTVNERVYGRLTPERIDEILRRLKDGALFPQSE